MEPRQKWEFIGQQTMVAYENKFGIQKNLQLLPKHHPRPGRPANLSQEPWVYPPPKAGAAAGTSSGVSPVATSPPKAAGGTSSGVSSAATSKAKWGPKASKIYPKVKPFLLSDNPRPKHAPTTPLLGTWDEPRTLLDATDPDDPMNYDPAYDPHSHGPFEEEPTATVIAEGDEEEQVSEPDEELSDDHDAPVLPMEWIALYSPESEPEPEAVEETPRVDDVEENHFDSEHHRQMEIIREWRRHADEVAARIDADIAETRQRNIAEEEQLHRDLDAWFPGRRYAVGTPTKIVIQPTYNMFPVERPPCRYPRPAWLVTRETLSPAEVETRRSQVYQALVTELNQEDRPPMVSSAVTVDEGPAGPVVTVNQRPSGPQPPQQEMTDAERRRFPHAAPLPDAAEEDESEATTSEDEPHVGPFQ